MKTKTMHSVLIFFLLFCVNTLFAQNEVFDTTQDPTAPYRLFRTNNIWTFIQLDTISGRMWQVQFDVQGSNRGATVLSLEDLAKGKKNVPGRFTLYSTQNIFNFILIDQIDGGTWQVQWSQDKEKRGVIPISK